MDSAERSSGAFTPRLPTTLSYGYYQINLWANDTKYHTSYASSYIYLGPISAYVYTDKSSYVIGEPCIVHVHAYVSGYYTDGAVNNASVVVSLVDSNGNVLNRSGMLKTDRNGDCTFVFSLSNLEEGTYTISTNVSYPRNKAEYVVVNDTINVREYMGMEVYVSTDKSQYCCGEEMKVYYVAYSNGTVVRSNATYIIYNPNVIEGYGVLAMGLDSSGEITYTIPDDYSGEIRVRVEVSDGRGGFVSKEATAYVVQGRVVVNADKTYYQAGDHVVFRYEVVGLENYSVLYSLVCDDEEVKRGMATDSEIPWDVPTDAAPERCTLYVYAYSNGRMVGGQCTVCRQNYRLFIWVDKRTYKPGSVINLHYRIERTEGAPEIAFPTTLTVTLNSGMSETYTISSYDGVVSYHVPANMPDGRYVIGASITGADNVGVYAQSVIEVKKGVNWFLVAIILLFILVIISLLQSFGILKNLERIKGRLPHIPRKRKPTFGRRISRLGRRYYTPPREWQPPEELEEMEESEQEI
ncbi:MAG: hypothetical protein DRN20_02580 [Thermoplasmata archaeon]|nr:MAG: hypothetical protein DRN20_02580 [Thermoplasmata archaeon]